MQFPLLALRNLSRQKRRTFMLASAIAFGVFIVTLVNGFSSGAVRILKENVADLIGGHVFISEEVMKDEELVSLVQHEARIMPILERLGVKEKQLSRTISAFGTLVFGSKTKTNQVLGIRWQDKKDVADNLGLDSAAWNMLLEKPNAIVISKKVAEDLKVLKGEELSFKTQTYSGQSSTATFVVAFITTDESDFAGITSFSSSEYLGKILNLPSPSAYGSLRIKLASLDLADVFALQLKEEMKKEGFEFKPKEDAMAMSFDSSVFRIGGKTENFDGSRWDVETVNDLLSEVNQISGGLALASFIMLVVLLLIIMIGIANTFRMILYERTVEIGTVRALGMQRKEVSRLLLYEALFLSLTGLILGVVLAFIGMLILGNINWGTDSFIAIFLQNGHLTFRIEALSMLVSMILVSGLSLLAALGPARKAAKLEPAVALRTAN